jgi:hypothetical protein
MMSDTKPGPRGVRIECGTYRFEAALEWDLAPGTCAAFAAVLPLTDKLVHCRWCGEGTWIPLGDADFGVDWENASSHPVPGQVLLYPGGASETEILIPYGATHFYSKAGPLAGNHFMTIVAGLEDLPRIGHDVLWTGAKDVTVTALNDVPDR